MAAQPSGRAMSITAIGDPHRVEQRLDLRAERWAARGVEHLDGAACDFDAVLAGGRLRLGGITDTAAYCRGGTVVVVLDALGSGPGSSAGARPSTSTSEIVLRSGARS